MLIEKPLIAKVSVTVRPSGSYGEQLYTFEREKTLSTNTQKELRDFVDAVAETVKKETERLTVLQMALAKVRSNMMAAQEELRQLEDKTQEGEPEIV